MSALLPRSPAPPARFRLPAVLAVALVLAGDPGAVRAGLDAEFAKANAAYESENYAEAESRYRALAEAGAVSADLFYNLGNALFRLDRPGEAALWFKRALHLDPRMAEARQNLKVLQKRTAFLEFSVTGIDRWLSRLSRREWIALTWIAAWTTLLLLTAAYALPPLREWRAAIFLAASIGLAGALAAKWAERRHFERLSPDTLAIVTGPEVQALVGPVPGADLVVDLPPGSEVRLLLDRGRWQFVAIPDDLRGWVRTEPLGKVVDTRVRRPGDSAGSHQ